MALLLPQCDGLPRPRGDTHTAVPTLGRLGLNRKATQLAPQQAGHVLRLMHSLELVQACNEALRAASDFCRASRCVPPAETGRGGGQRGEGWRGEGRRGEAGRGRHGEGRHGEGRDGEGRDGEGRNGEGRDGEGRHGDGRGTERGRMERGGREGVRECVC